MIKLKDILLEVENNQEQVEVEIEDALNTLSQEIKNTDLGDEEVEEVLGAALSIAGVALSTPEIIRLIGKFVNFLKKIPGLKSLSGDKLIALGDKWHYKLVSGLIYALSKAGVKDKIKAKKFADILFHLIVAILLVAGGYSAFKFASKGNIIGSTLKSAINAVKVGEIRAFVLRVAAEIV
jgi:hypothetical protein